MSDPATPPQWASDYFRDASVAAPHGPGLVGHVPTIAALLIVQGALEVLFSLLLIAFFVFVMLVPHEDLRNLRGFAVFVVVLSIPGLVVGALRIIAGLFNLRYRRRLLGMTALGLGLILIFTAYCAPTAIALAVYGLIVYLNESVIAAFDMGDRGCKPAEIKAAFVPRL